MALQIDFHKLSTEYNTKLSSLNALMRPLRLKLVLMSFQLIIFVDP